METINDFTPEEIEETLHSLADKGFVKRIPLEGGVGFELTDLGRFALNDTGGSC